MAELPRAFVVHETPSRLRLRIPDRRHDETYFGEARRQLLEKMPAARIDANPVTASILICGPAGARGFLDAEAGPFRLSREPESDASLVGQFGEQFEALNSRILTVSGGCVDPRAFIILALIVSAMFQIARGRVFAPAITLLWYAGEAIRAWTPDEKRR